VILTVREPEKWYDSYVNSLLWLYQTWLFKPFAYILPMGQKLQVSIFEVLFSQSHHLQAEKMKEHSFVAVDLRRLAKEMHVATSALIAMPPTASAAQCLGSCAHLHDGICKSAARVGDIILNPKPRECACLLSGWMIRECGCAQAIGRWWLIWEFGDDTMSDKDACIQAYLKHNAHIRATIPSDQLLEWEAKDGWEPLCR
jgi:hypothetical protein